MRSTTFGSRFSPAVAFSVTRFPFARASMSFRKCVRYGFGCLSTAAQYRLAKFGLPSKLFPVTARQTRSYA